MPDGRYGAASRVFLERGITQSRLRYVIADDSLDHRLAATWRDAGMAFLLGETPIAPPAAAP